MSIRENYKEQYQNIVLVKVLWEMLGEFERFTNISVPTGVLEYLMNSSQLTPSPSINTNKVSSDIVKKVQNRFYDLEI